MKRSTKSSWLRKLCEKVRIPLVIIVIAYFFTSLACAQYTIVYETFRVAWLHPGELDAFIQANSTYYNSQYFECSDTLKQRMHEIDAKTQQQCASHTDPNWHLECLRSNPGAGVPQFLSDLESVITTGRPWLETISGQRVQLIVQIYDYLLQDYIQTTYQQLRFVLGQAYADAALQQQYNIYYEPLLQYMEIMRVPLTCY
jgi:hypothetical protein